MLSEGSAPAADSVTGGQFSRPHIHKAELLASPSWRRDRNRNQVESVPSTGPVSHLDCRFQLARSEVDSLAVAQLLALDAVLVTGLSWVVGRHNSLAPTSKSASAPALRFCPSLVPWTMGPHMMSGGSCAGCSCRVSSRCLIAQHQHQLHSCRDNISSSSVIRWRVNFSSHRTST